MFLQGDSVFLPSNFMNFGIEIKISFEKRSRVTTEIIWKNKNKTTNVRCDVMYGRTLHE